MERIKKLNRYQKGILLLLAVMTVFFTVIYSIESMHKGFLYRGVILERQEENGNTVYTGKVNGEEASFTVTKDKVITHRYGDKIFGPYTMREDASLLSKDEEDAAYLT